MGDLDGIIMSDSLSTSRTLSLVGIIMNIVISSIVILILFAVFSSITSIFDIFSEIPFEWFPSFNFDWIILVSEIIVIFLIIFGILLPAIGYMKAHPESKSLAASLFILSGAITIVFIGGIILIVAGILVLTEESDEVYPTRSEIKIQSTIGDRSICSIWGSALKGDENFCGVCGAKVTKR